VARDDVSDYWKDETSRVFQEKYLDPLDPKIRRSINAMVELAAALTKAERECGSYD
jgi:hypothetical protein